MNHILPHTFYQTTDTPTLARQLLGKILATRIHGTLTTGIITETEAYTGIHDKASHSYGNRRTKRTETMYLPGGHAYIYLCYGIHHLFNIVTGPRNHPSAILIRAIQPLHGLPTILKRRHAKKPTPNLTSGPGTLTQALAITTKHDRTNLTLGKTIWIEDHGIQIKQKHITTTPRIGIDYAQEHTHLPYRFLITPINLT
jgi:DNA-3-methyladenine glycosylase